MEKNHTFKITELYEIQDLFLKLKIIIRANGSDIR